MERDISLIFALDTNICVNETLFYCKNKKKPKTK